MRLPVRSSSGSNARRCAKNWTNSSGTGSKRTTTWEVDWLNHNDDRPMFEDINDLYQEVILDHCKQPRNFREMPQATCSAQGHNPLCGDQLKLFLTLEGDKISDISFVG